MTLVRHQLRGDAWRTNQGYVALLRALARKGAKDATLSISGATPGDAVSLVDAAWFTDAAGVVIPWRRVEDPAPRAAELRARAFGLRLTWRRPP